MGKSSPKGNERRINKTESMYRTLVKISTGSKMYICWFAMFRLSQKVQDSSCSVQNWIGSEIKEHKKANGQKFPKGK